MLPMGLAHIRFSVKEIRHSVSLQGCQERSGREGAKPITAVSGAQRVSRKRHMLSLPSLFC